MADEPKKTNQSAMSRVAGFVLGRPLGMLGGFCILAITAATMIEVVKRYILGSGTTWSVEISSHLMVALAFLPLAYTSRMGGHVRVDMVISMLPRPIVRILQIITTSLALIYSLIFAWQGLDLTMQAIRNGWTSGAPLRIPSAPIFVLVPIGMLLLGAQLAIELYHAFKPTSTGTPQNDDEGISARQA